MLWWRMLRCCTELWRRSRSGPERCSCSPGPDDFDPERSRSVRVLARELSSLVSIRPMKAHALCAGSGVREITQAGSQNWDPAFFAPCGCNKSSANALTRVGGQIDVWPIDTRNLSKEDFSMKRCTQLVSISALFLGLAIVLAPSAAQAKGNGGNSNHGGSSKSSSHDSKSYCHDSKSYCHDNYCHDYCHDYCRPYCGNYCFDNFCYDYCFPTYCQPLTYCPDYSCTPTLIPYCSDYCTPGNFCGKSYSNFKGSYKTGGMYKTMKK